MFYWTFVCNLNLTKVITRNLSTVGKADCGDLSEPTWCFTVEPEELVAELAFRGMEKRNYEHEPFLPLHLVVLYSKN